MISYIVAPSRFYAERFLGGFRWRYVFVPPMLCFALRLWSAVIMRGKLDEVRGAIGLPQQPGPLGGILTVMASLGVFAQVGLAFLLLFGLDVLMNDSRKPRRLAEVVGWSFLSQIPYGLVAIAVVWFWTPVAPRFSMSPVQMLSDLRAMTTADPILSTMRILSYYSTLWLVVMLVAGLRVTSQLSKAQTMLAASVLLTVFFGPQVVQLLR